MKFYDNPYDQDAVLHVLNVVDGVAPAASLHEMRTERLSHEGEKLVESVANEAQERGGIPRFRRPHQALDKRTLAEESN